jgi:C4-dicarboxylate-specific signal transduction histidine kinase
LKSTLDVYEVLVEFLRQREGRSKMAGVDVRLTGKAGLKISFSHARFLQILENLFQNSIYWLEEHSAEDQKAEKYIQVEVDESGFSWRDSAKGIRAALEDSLFEPYVTDKPLSKGQGLGLFIVNSYLQAERCTIALLHERNKFRRRYVFRVDLSGAVRR